MSKILNEYIETNEFKLGTCGYIKEDGSLIQLDEYHGEEDEYYDKKYPEFSNTHAEDDTCIRLELDNEPNEAQYKRLEEIIDRYLDAEEYCKVEVWDGTPCFYKIFSLVEDACDDMSWEEKIGNWTGYKIIRILKNFYATSSKDEFLPEALVESLLLEKNRQELISKSKNSDPYKDQSKGRNRWDRRNRSSIATRVDQYNKINMNDFFKRDELKVGINVHGETNDYIVLIRYDGALREIAEQIKRNNNKLEFKCVLIALQRVFNSGNVFVSCTCPDWKYRQAYFASKDGYNSGALEVRASDITNPGNTKGAGCKHVNLVIGNVDWIMKVASVINNYIHYMEEHMQRQYADLIFPKLFGIPYQKAVQLNLFDNDDEMEDDEETIQLSNRYGRERTLFNKDKLVNNQKNWKKPEQIEEPEKPHLQLNFQQKEQEVKDNIENAAEQDIEQDSQE